MLEQEKVRLADDLSRQNETLKELIDQKKGLETELQEKKNLVTNCGFQKHSLFPCYSNVYWNKADNEVASKRRK